jgi:hypothetical protein
MLIKIALSTKSRNNKIFQSLIHSVCFVDESLNITNDLLELCLAHFLFTYLFKQVKLIVAHILAI